MHDMVTGAASSGASPIIRVRGPTIPLIKRALDTGAQYVVINIEFLSLYISAYSLFSALLVPMVNTAADAKAIVQAAKFPPVGIRGQGSPFAGFAQGYPTPYEYVANANKDVLIMVQIESVEGLKNVDEIAQVDGVGKFLQIC
jgi:4-hydroxy-2-oxoheptanedioate aldolase